MLNYAEIASISTIVPVTPLPQDRHQDFVVSTFSYAIGPIDPAHLTSLQVPLSTGETCPLLVPIQTPASWLSHPTFQKGVEWGYLDWGSQEMWTVPKLVNGLYADLEPLRHPHDPDCFHWSLGFVLGVLASITQDDRTLALTGLAHLCFLLPLLTQERPLDWPPFVFYDAWSLHQSAVKAYRARVRTYREHRRQNEPLWLRDTFKGHWHGNRESGRREISP